MKLKIETLGKAKSWIHKS